MVALKQYIGIACLLVLSEPHTLLAAERYFDISTLAQVSESGKVEITLNIKNKGARALYNIQPIFHFHHSMHKMPLVSLMEEGAVVSQKTLAHPSVLRIGSYPIMVALKYQLSTNEKSILSQAHADSFYFRESVVSVIDGEITSGEEAGAHQLNILLRNNSPSLKNVRFMLLLPPELAAVSFNGMMGFTMRPGEEKYFKVPVSKLAGNPGGNYPVHLMVEYAEMLKHYASVIPGEIHFPLSWSEGARWAQMLAFIFLIGSVILLFKNKTRDRAGQGSTPSL